VNLLGASVAWLIKKLNLVTKDEMMSLATDIRAKFSQYKGNVDAKIALLQEKIDSMPGPEDQAELEALMADVKAANAEFEQPEA